MTESDTTSWLVCERTAARMAKLQGVLRGAVEADDLQLRLMAAELLFRSGKRLRPALLLLAATFSATESPEATLLKAAAALEMVHVASLYHDDVMDRAPLRRQGASANARWGNSLASLAGTYLFSRAIVLLAGLGPDVNGLASRAFVELCSGQLQEVENAYNLDLTEEQHLHILERKTGTLFALPCEIGACLGHLGTHETAALAEYGRHLGVAFQLADDALDLVGDTERMGKAAAKDLREGVYGLAVLRALQRSDPIGLRLRELIGQVQPTNDDIASILSVVGSSGAVNGVFETAREYAARARASLAPLPAGAARSSLERLTGYAVSRAS